jgi:hypothetical protein
MSAYLDQFKHHFDIEMLLEVSRTLVLSPNPYKDAIVFLLALPVLAS